MDASQIDALRAQHGRLLVVEVDDQRTLAFRPFDAAKLNDLRRLMAKAEPAQLPGVITTAIGFCCVHGKEHFDDVAREFPRLINGAGEEEGGSVFDGLLSMARGPARIRVV